MDLEKIAEYMLDDRIALSEAIAAAGGRIVEPRQDEIQIDIDSEAAAARFADIFGMLADRVGAYVVDRHHSRSGPPHEHITLAVDRQLSNLERIALQAIAGSDPRRELFGFLRVIAGVDMPTAFAEYPNQPATSSAPIEEPFL